MYRAPSSSTPKRLYQGVPAQLSAPTLNTIATATTGGTLAAQQWNFAVSSVDAAGNETTVSPELYVTSTGTTSTVTVTWFAASGAAQYKIYRRSPVSGAPLGLVATVSSGPLTYTDVNITTTTNPPSVNGTGETGLYVAPTTTPPTIVTVKQILVTNSNAQAATASVSLVPSGGTSGVGNRLVPQLWSVRANDVRAIDLEQVMTGGDFLSGVVSAPGVVLTISGLVQT